MIDAAASLSNLCALGVRPLSFLIPPYFRCVSHLLASALNNALSIASTYNYTALSSYTHTLEILALNPNDVYVLYPSYREAELLCSRATCVA